MPKTRLTSFVVLVTLRCMEVRTWLICQSIAISRDETHLCQEKAADDADVRSDTSAEEIILSVRKAHVYNL